MNKYEIKIYWSGEDKVYIAEVPELLGCMTHGDTRTAALANAEEAIQLWVDTAKEFGNPIPKPRSARVTSRNSVSKKKRVDNAKSASERR
jgi:predicted RNase H-like HicB family nuclease